MLFQNLSANVSAVHKPMCYVRRCEGFAALVVEIQGVEPPQRYAKIFRADQLMRAKRSTLLSQNGLTQESQFRRYHKMVPTSKGPFPSRQ